MFNNWHEAENFDNDREDRDPLDDCLSESDLCDMFDAFRYEREVNRNTFLNRFECDPQPSLYDGGPVDLQPLFQSTFQPQIRESFTVKNGITTKAMLDIPSEMLRAHSANRDRAFAGADILLASGAPVEALQGGLVVYSSRVPPAGERIDLNGLIVPVGDLSRYEGDIVIVQSWDEKTRGVRYHIYSGLDSASVVAGDRIKAGQSLGKADATGMQYEVHRNAVQGPAVAIESTRRAS